MKIIDLPGSENISISFKMPNPPELKRTMSAGSLALNAINMTIGAGIFVMPAIVAARLGAASFIAYLLCAGLMILVMLCFADIGSRVTRSGGSYAYVESAFGSYAGFLINILFWFGYAIAADAALANAMADMIGILVPSLNIKPVRIVFFVVLFGLFGFINIRGARNGTKLMMINTGIKLLPLIILIVFGIFNLEQGNLAVETWPSVRSLGEMALILFFAFAGSETALGNSGEVRDPQRNIPRGIMMGLAGILIFYLLIQFVAQGVLGDALPLNTNAPLAAVAKSMMGDFGYYLLLIAAIISIYGNLSGDVLSTSRLIYAGGKDRIYPVLFGRIHKKYQSPANAIILYTLLIILLSSIGEFRGLALVSSSAVLIVYLAVILATLQMKLSKRDLGTGGFSLPGGSIIPILAALVVCWFLWHVTASELKAMGGFFLIVSLIYFFYSRKNISQHNRQEADESDEHPSRG